MLWLPGLFISYSYCIQQGVSVFGLGYAGWGNSCMITMSRGFWRRDFLHLHGYHHPSIHLSHLSCAFRAAHALFVTIWNGTLPLRLPIRFAFVFIILVPFSLVPVSASVERLLFTGSGFCTFIRSSGGAHGVQSKVWRRHWLLGALGQCVDGFFLCKLPILTTI